MAPTEFELIEYLTPVGISPFGRWFDRLDATAAAKVQTALVRLQLGNTSSVKALGAGISEVKIDFGPGYRVYFAREGERIVVLLGGGTKKRQDRDIAEAKAAWATYKILRKDKQ